ncbi:MAG: DUF302 domain-containing protein [Anaerolineales bacterium]|nr:DUF302 domain-containing protein [Anaerolineales bacterium]
MIRQEDLIRLTSKYNFDETVERLKKAIQTADFLVIHEIDTQQILERHGITIKGFKQLLYFHPSYMRNLLNNNPDLAIQVPLKFLIKEEMDGWVKVSYIKPLCLFGADVNLEGFAKELERNVFNISESIIA